MAMPMYKEQLTKIFTYFTSITVYSESDKTIPMRELLEWCDTEFGHRSSLNSAQWEYFFEPGTIKDQYSIVFCFRTSDQHTLFTLRWGNT